MGGSIAAALRGGNSKRRQVKRKPDGTAKPHRYVQAWALTSTDFVGRFLGVNVGTPLQRKLSKLAITAYSEEVVRRGADEVLISKQNAIMMLNWDQLMESPMMKRSLQKSDLSDS